MLNIGDFWLFLEFLSNFWPITSGSSPKCDILEGWQKYVCVKPFSVPLLFYVFKNSSQSQGNNFKKTLGNLLHLSAHGDFYTIVVVKSPCIQLKCQKSNFKKLIFEKNMRKPCVYSKQSKMAWYIHLYIHESALRIFFLNDYIGTYCITFYIINVRNEEKKNNKKTWYYTGCMYFWCNSYFIIFAQ